MENQLLIFSCFKSGSDGKFQNDKAKRFNFRMQPETVPLGNFMAEEINNGV